MKCTRHTAEVIIRKLKTAKKAKRKTQLKKEIAHLKKLLAEAELEKAMLKELAKGNLLARNAAAGPQQPCGGVPGFNGDAERWLPVTNMRPAATERATVDWVGSQGLGLFSRPQVATASPPTLIAPGPTKGVTSAPMNTECRPVRNISSTDRLHSWCELGASSIRNKLQVKVKASQDVVATTLSGMLWKKKCTSTAEQQPI